MVILSLLTATWAKSAFQRATWVLFSFKLPPQLTTDGYIFENVHYWALTINQRDENRSFVVTQFILYVPCILDRYKPARLPLQGLKTSQYIIFYCEDLKMRSMEVYIYKFWQLSKIPWFWYRKYSLRYTKNTFIWSYKQFYSICNLTKVKG